MTEPLVLLAAGGTGGHLFPAEALAHALCRRGAAVELVTDERALRYGGAFPARAMHTIPAGTPRGGTIAERSGAILRLGLGVLKAIRHIRRSKPAVVVGFGGYPTVPPLFAASLLGVPTVLHEANGVMGKANRFLASRVDAIAAGFPLSDAVLAAKLTVTGNPLRPNALAAVAEPYPVEDGRLRLLVTGGSQGARVMADVVPAAVASLPEELRGKLVIVQQTRPEDVSRVKAAYDGAGVPAELAPFFSDLPHRMAQAQLVIARAGASTVSELAAIGRAAILVPLPHALDQDQASNAAVLQATGAAEVVRQENFTPQYLSDRLSQLLSDLPQLRTRAEKAKSAGVTDAAERLAELTLKMAGVVSSRRTQGVNACNSGDLE